MRYKVSGKPRRHAVIAVLVAAAIVFTTAFYSNFQSYAANDNGDSKLEQTIDQKAGKLTVSADAEKGVLPGDAELKVKAVGKTSDDYKAVEKRLKENADKNNKDLSGFLAYDISFWSDGKEIEPDDKVDITMKWSDAVRPDEASKSDEVSVIHLKEKKDGGIRDSKVIDLTKDKDKNNKADIKADSRKEVKSAKITVDSFSVFALQWTDSRSDEEKAEEKEQSQKIKVHYMDESGKDIADAETVDFGSLTGKEGAKILSREIKGYDYKNAKIGEVSADGLKADNGELFYEEEGKWVKVSDSDLYLFYEKTEKDSAVSKDKEKEEKSGKASDVKKENTSKSGYESGRMTADTDDYKVTVSYSAGAKIPENAKLRVYELSKDEQAFKSAKAAVLETKGLNFDADSLGMEAVDISIMNGDEEYEPQEPVKVSIRMKNIPKNVNNVDIHHIPSAAMASQDAVSNPIRKAPGLANKVNAVMAAEDVAVKKGGADTEFSVSGFSVFTITWTKSENDSTRIGQVNLHYVDVNGLEINRTTEIQNTDLSKYDGQVVKIADWVNNDTTNGANTRKVSGYIFQKAALQSIDGTQITGVKVEHDTDNANNYKLYYTTADDPAAPGAAWTQYMDSVSKKGANNADIYLVFKSTAQRMRVHFVDEDGKILMPPVYKYADQIYSTYGEKGFNIQETDITKNPWAEEIQNYAYTGRAQCGEEGKGWQGFAFSTVKASATGTDGNGSNTIYRFEYKLKNSDTNWVHMTGTDVYLIYKKTTGKKLLTIHYIDTDGNAITDTAGNALSKTIDAGDWEDADKTWYGIYGLGDNIEGYTKAASANQNGLLVAKSGSSLAFGEKVVTANGAANGDEVTVGSLKGYEFKYIRYRTRNGKREFQAGTGNDPGYDTKTVTNDDRDFNYCNRAWVVNGDFDIYLRYQKNTAADSYTYTVHYIDTDGNVISPSTNSDKHTIAVSGSDPSVTVDVSSLAKSISGYTAVASGNTALLGRSTEESGGIPMTSMTFTPRIGGEWDYAITSAGDNGESTTTLPRQLVIHNLNIYVLYKANTTTPAIPDNKTVTIHFVDKDGNPLLTSNGRETTWGTRITLNKNGSGKDNNTNASFTDWNGYDFTKSSSDDGGFGGSTGYTTQLQNAGYTFVGEYLGPTANTDADKLVTNTAPNTNGSGKYVQWKYQDDKWYMSHGGSANAEHNTTDRDVFEGTLNDVTDIYWVYTKNIKVHYVYVSGRVSDTNDDLQLAKLTEKEDVTISSIPFSADTAVQLNRENSDEAKTNYAPAIIGNYSYAGTRVGPAWSNSLTYADLGANIQSVYLGNGQLTYYGDTTVTLTYLRNNTWYHAENNGRRFELIKGNDGNYTLNDSRHGSLSLDESSTATDDTKAVTYVATYHGEAQTTEYKVTYYPNNPSSTRYSLTVSDWTPNDQTDVYEIYVDTSKYSLWVEDDQMYSGYLIANKASGVPGNGTYAWYKTVTDSSGNTTTSPVLRKQTGIHYNIEYDPKARTWLDVEADEGGRNSTTQTAVSYYVTYTYTEGGEQKTIQSQSLSIPYYSELKNGDFNAVKYDKQTTQVSNSDYKENGIWQTTGLGNNAVKANTTGKDIEIINNSNGLGNYAWYGSTATVDGDHQFAELNCEASGALYQDVVTHPNEQLHYWLSHRARGRYANSTPEYDTMYLIIMPTKLAMTSGANGGELKTQSELNDFIKKHGGYDNDLATSVSQEVTHAEDDDGVMIVKISSNDQFWHTIRSINGYKAKAGLTRFFFAAGPTASGDQTVGNFIDAVGFSQTFPKTDGFNLSVSKTFKGLTEDQLADLAKAKTDAAGTTTTNQKAFKISISDRFIGTSGSTSGKPIVALNGAELGFNVSGSAGNYTFTPTATLKGTNILTGNSSGTVTANSDGSITMTWDFLDQSMADEDGNEATGDTNRFYYTVKEENAGVTDKYLTSVETHNNTSKDGHQTRGSGGSQYIHQGDSAVFTLNNTYSGSSASEQPQMIITKTFSGMTPAAVDAMLPGYTLKVQKTGEGTDASDFISLTGDHSNPIKSAEGTTDAASKGVTATVEETANTDSTTTLRWIIKGWGAGTYTITEGGYDSDAYPLKEATVTYRDPSRVKNQSLDDVKSGETVTGKTKTDVSVGNASEIQVKSDSTKNVSVKEGESSLGTIAAADQPAADTNLIVAQYTLNKKVTHFFVWTPESLSANVSQAIVEKINSKWSLTGSDVATISNTEFHSSTNPGTISVGSGGAGTISYDSEENSHMLSFTNTGTLTWDRFFSTRYWVGSSSTDTKQCSDTDIAVKNSYLPAVRVLKVDSKNQTTPLAGAKFKLFKVSGTGSGASRSYLTVGTNNDLTWDSNSVRAAELETNAEGFAVHNRTGSTALEIISQLQAGTYYIEETKAPDGYNMPATPVFAFTVNDLGIVSKAAAENGKIGDVTVDQDRIDTIDWNSPYYTIHITNTAGIALPLTGGEGVLWMYLIGAILIAASISIYLYRKKKMEGQT